jgi:glycine/D-amino acid oxidase-like deaminating enzyme
MSDPDIAVVGGGIAGASVAYHLSGRTDRPTVVYERGTLSGETTAKSAAFFGFYGSDAERPLKRYGMALYNEFLSEPRAAPRHDLVGRLRLATTRRGADRLEERFGDAWADDPVAYLPGDSIRESVLLPELDADAVTGATYRPGVGYHRPRELAREFAARAEERGARFETGTSVVDVAVEDGRLRELAIEANGVTETVTPEAVVVAAGPWNPTVAEHAGLDLPVSHSLAPVLRLQREDDPPHSLPIVSHVESGVYARGHEGDSVLVGHYPNDPDAERRYDPDEVDDRVPDARREEMLRVVEDLLPGIADAPIAEDWVGVRSHTPDGDPIVGWTGVEGLSVVAFDSSGIQLAPALGWIVARQLVDGEPTEHYESVSVTRIAGHDDVRFSL